MDDDFDPDMHDKIGFESASQVSVAISRQSGIARPGI
jgi:hypothetical protein